MANSGKAQAIRTILSVTPFMSMSDMVSIHGWGRSPLRRQIKRLEADGQVASVPHVLEGRKATHRYFLTDTGVVQLAKALKEPLSDIMDRPGATGYGLASYHRVLDIVAVVYKLVSTIGRCYKTPEVNIDLLSAGPLDAVLRIPDAPYSLGVIAYRHAMSFRYFEAKVRAYARLGSARPSALLVVSPGHMAEHTVARLVALNSEGLPDEYQAVIASLEMLGDPDMRVWRKIRHYHDEGHLQDMWDVLDGVPKNFVRRVEPQTTRWRGAALPRPGWRTRPILTPGEHRALSAIADWPLAKDEVIAAVAKLALTSVHVIVRTLRKHELVRRVPVRRGDDRLVLTDRGINFICRSARADTRQERNFWSSQTRQDGKFIGSKLRTLHREIRHTDLVYEIVRRFMLGAVARRIQITPAHKSVWHFRQRSERYTSHIEPDACIAVEMQGGARHVLLLEAERGGMSRKYMENRLKHYDKYFRTNRSGLDYPVPPMIAVVHRDPGTEAKFSVAQVNARMTHLPTILTNLDELERSSDGPFGLVWHRPGDHGRRAGYHALMSNV